MKALVKKPRLTKYRGIKKSLRFGKGFSKPELAELGLTIKDAVKMKIPVDPRRRSKHEWNIRSLRDILKSLKDKARNQ